MKPVTRKETDMLELFGHPFSSYTWKALIAVYENDIAITFRMIDGEHPENIERLQAHSPQGKFPLLIDGDRAIFESSTIIEYLQHAHPGETVFVPASFQDALEVRMLDRFFDNYVMNMMQPAVDDALRAPEDRCPALVASAMQRLQCSYAWLDKRMQDRDYACGSTFTLADCAAAPALFYADWVCPIGEELDALRRYRRRLLERPSVARCVDDARPYRHLFPLGAPDRD